MSQTQPKTAPADAHPLPLGDAGLVLDMALEQSLGLGPGSLTGGLGSDAQKQRQRRLRARRRQDLGARAAPWGAPESLTAQ